MNRKILGGSVAIAVVAGVVLFTILSGLRRPVSVAQGSTNNHQPAHTHHHGLLPPNVVRQPVPAASIVPRLWYKYIVADRFRAANTMYGPDLRAYAKHSLLKYLENIEGATFVHFEDISSDPSVLMGNYNRFYRVKFYYGVLRLKLKNPHLVPALVKIQYRQFTVVQMKKNGPWLLDLDQDVSRRVGASPQTAVFH